MFGRRLKGLPHEPISFLEADTRYVSKELFASLSEAIKLSEARIMAAIAQLTTTMNSRHEDDNRRYESMENRLRAAEAAIVDHTGKISSLEKPTSLNVMGQSIIVQVVGSIATIGAIAALGYSYIHSLPLGK